MDDELELKCTIELMAKPKEVAVDAAKKIISNIEEGGKHLAVSNVEYAEPKLIKDDFYSTYAVFNIKGTIPEIFGFVMDYAPTSIELIKTKEIKVSPPDLQALLNDLAGRLNDMDQKIKIFSGQTILLSRENEELKKKLDKQENHH